MRKKKNILISSVVILSLIIASLIGWLQSEKDEKYINAINEISNKYSNAAMVDQDTFEKYIEEDVLNRYNDPLEVVYFYAMKARYELLIGKTDEVFESIDNAIEYAKKSDYYDNVIIDIYSHGLELSNMKHNTYKAIEYSHKLINILNNETTVWASEIQKQKVQIAVYSKQLLLLSDYKIIDKAKYYFDLLNSITIHKDLPPIVERNAIFAKVIYLTAINDYEAAKVQAELAYESLKKQDEETGSDIQDAGLMNIAYSELLIGDLDEVETKLVKAINFYERMNDQFTIYLAKSNLGLYYLKVGDYDNAFLYFMESIKGMDETNSYYDKLEVLEILIENKEIFQNYCDMNKILEEHYYLEKKLQEERETSNVIQAIIDINDELNNGYIKSIDEKNEVITKRNRIVVWGSVILLLAVIILFVLLNKYKFEVRKRTANEEELKKIIERDYLTGCKTKEIGINKVKELIDAGIGFTISVIDIDNFKKINDNFGHIFGDEVLRKVASVLMKDLDDNDFVIRFGGEEFILVTMKPLNEAKELFEEKRIKVNEIKFDENISVTISQGAVDIRDENTVKKLIEKADILLYKAKRTGKNRVEI